MDTAHAATGIAILALFSLAALAGGLAWWRFTPGGPSAAGRVFWVLLRAGQAALVVEAALGGALMLVGRRAPDLHLVYGLVPLAVSFAAEQLRVSAAETVLEARGHDSAQAVGEAAEEEQRAVVRAIVRRELGVMTVAALVILALALRAMGG